MTNHIPLNRQFVRWDGDVEIDIGLAASLDGHSRSFDWSALLERRRVVILSEAGSGKSTELREQAKCVGAGGRTTFISTLQRIGQRGGLEAALGAAEWRRFKQWQSTAEPCWMFLDSVDEAKRADFRLFDVLTDVADAIDGFSARTHIVLSGRVSDWEFKRDLKTLLERIPLPPPDRRVDSLSADQELIDAVRAQRRESAPGPSEEPLVVVMAALDRSRVETFARARGVTDVGRMLAEIQRKNLWAFVRRPTDLDWMASYWRVHRGFGSLQEMLDASITERLKEANIALSRGDQLEAAKARRVVERIGAALVLQKQDTISVPDADGDTRLDVAYLDIKDVAPDLSPSEQGALITRPIFDPATPGFVRLHNDNQGAVRGFLAAKWLVRLRTDGNLPVSRIFELLFAELYGVKLVIPSMRATAAWLALWDAETAQEIVARDPRLLMDAGDPSSLPLDVRVHALDGILETAIKEGHFDIPDHDALRRFAQPDLADYVRERWTTLRGAPGARALLMLLIHLGKLNACADIAVEAVQGGYGDRYTPMFAGRALLSTGSPSQLKDYVSHLVEQVREVHSTMVWDALEDLYPKVVVARDLLKLLSSMRGRGGDGGLDLRYHGPRLVARIPDTTSAQAIVEGLLDSLEVKVDIYRESSDPKDEQILETLEVAAARCASLNPAGSLPDSVIDAAIRVGESRRIRRRNRTASAKEALDLVAQLNVSAERRRLVLWRCAKWVRAAKEAPISHPRQLHVIGLGLQIQDGDIGWLIEDIRSRSDENDLRLATNAAMTIWREVGDDPALLARIRAANPATVVQQTINNWLKSPQRDPEHERFEIEQAKIEAQTALEEVRANQSWIDFRKELLANPGLLIEYAKPHDGKVDARLYHLWWLLRNLGQNSSRSAIADLAPLVPLFGEEVVEAFRRAMIQYWRLLHTSLPSEVSPEERNTSCANDLIGVVGVTLESGSKPGWALELTDEEAKLATRFATRELAGFPKWLDDLAADHPTIVQDILWGYLSVDLNPKGDKYRSRLEDVAGASEAVVALMAPRMLDWIRRCPGVPGDALDAALRLIARDSATLVASIPLASRRSRTSRSRVARAAYISLVYAHDAAKATDLLIRVLEAMNREEQALLAQAVLPRVFGSHYRRGRVDLSKVPFADLERLVWLAFEQVRPDKDNDRANGEAYSPDERDHAEAVRSTLFTTLVSTPGYATYAAIQRFRQTPDFPVWDRRLRELAFARAAGDSEREALRTQDVLTFEERHILVPATSADLQRVGVARLRDIAHQLLDGDFNQGLTVARLPDEADVQNWFADRLTSMRNLSYSLEREPHVADEKEPDIRLGSLRDPAAKSPVEIKVAGSWTLKQLERALTVQLRGRYLRDKDNRFGILLVVHNTVRPRGWKHEGRFLKFSEVMDHLEAIALGMASADALAPQMRVVGIDLSSCAQRIRGQETKRSNTDAEE